MLFIRQFIFPKEKTEHLRFFDVLIITAILFGHFILLSTELFLESFNAGVSAILPAFSLSPVLLSENGSGILETVAEAVDSTTEGVAYSGNLQFQAMMLILAFLYLWIRNFDFKQIPFRFRLSVIPWFFIILAVMGLSADLLYLLFDNGYNYFTKEILMSLDFFELFRILFPRSFGYGRPKIQVADPSLFHTDPYFLPHLPGTSFRTDNRHCFRSDLLLLLSSKNQKSPSPCFGTLHGRYVRFRISLYLCPILIRKTSMYLQKCNFFSKI